MRTSNQQSLIGRIVAGIILLLILVGAFLVIQNAVQTNDSPRTITYEVTSSAGAIRLKYTTAPDQMTDLLDKNSPWRESFFIPVGTMVILNGYNPNQTGNLSCRIYINGTLWKSSSVEYPADKVACAGIVY